MALHRLTRITLGVPNVDVTAAYYNDFGLIPDRTEQVSIYGSEVPVSRDVHRFHTVDGGEQLRITHSPVRRLLELGIGAENPDDLDRIAANLAQLDITVERSDDSLRAFEPGTRASVIVEIARPLEQSRADDTPFNGPGRTTRPNVRAPGVLREQAVHPRKLGHVVLGSTDEALSRRFFTAGLGFKISDEVPGLAAFMRCSTDHHNVLVQQAPLAFLHHTSWQVEDVDEIGRGATAMLAIDPARHTWGLGRHHIGSNFFWYLKDPAGNFSEYYSDLDCIVDDALWTPQVWEGSKGLYNWGPPPPASFLAPEDLAALMAGAHAAS